MKHKILIADDSLTIQKVIKITLANEPFDLFECSTASDLESSMNSTRPSIILLDFNLSEEKTGYDLAREIKSSSPTAKILMLFGTFDTIDETLLEESGVSHKIVKPFDGTKFINLCRVMADELDTEDSQSITSSDADFSTEKLEDAPVEQIEAVEEEIQEVQADEDMWVVEGNQTFPEEIEQVEHEQIVHETSTPTEKSTNPLVDTMKDWGVDIPAVIGAAADDHLSDIPSVIGESSSAHSAKQANVETVDTAVSDQEEVILPSEDDLAFPDEIELSPDESSEGQSVLPNNSDLEFPDIEEVKLEVEKSSPQLRSLDIDESETPVVEEVEISSGGTDTEEAVNALKAEIEEDTEELEDAGLWGADVVVEDDGPVAKEEDKEDSFDALETSDLPHIESHKLEKVVDNTQKEDQDSFDEIFDEEHEMSGPEDFPADVMEENVITPKNTLIEQAVSTPKISNLDLEKELKEKLAPVVEEFVKQYCAQNVEKIAWEIIPDLAENLIKKEIQKISDSVMNP